MEKLYVMLAIFLVLLLGLVSADTTYYEEDYSALESVSSTSFSLTKLRYESYPVSPGDYFTIWVQVEKNNAVKKDVSFEFVEEYPFFLDSNEVSVRSFKDLGSEIVVLEYKVRVDNSAVDGENVLKVRQKLAEGSSIIHEFDILVEDVQTSFDAVVQESVDGEVSIALANVGMNDANAAIVRIPDQDGVVISGTTGQMIGNLEQGDYTVVGFSVSGSSSVLKMQVDYTDYIGVRRSEIVEVSFIGGSRASVDGVDGEMPVAGSRMRPGMQVEESGFSYVWLIWAFVFVVVFYFGYEHFKKKRNLKGKSSDVPKWMKKSGGAKK